ncbi:hypothetical protein [Natrinema sp. 74]|uniref:hypothetical protein n=1 Tax=Natrinema sp. 74 TaxID=3384159 RepID=UPI0038D4E6F9
MTGTNRTRRSIIVATGSFAVIGYVGTDWLSDTDSTGSDDFTAGTVPDGSDPLLLIRPRRGRDASITAAVVTSLLAATSLDKTPGLPRDALDAGRDATDLHKLAVVGSNGSGESAVVAWADWSKTELRERVSASISGKPKTDAYEGRTVYLAGDAAGATLADGVVTLGTERQVRSVIDVWHADAAPVDDAVLHPFDRTDRTAPVRFATTGLAFHDDRTGPRTDEYAPVVNTAVDAVVDGTDATVTITYEVESIDATDRLANAIKRDLGLTPPEGPVEPALPRGIRSDLAVTTDPAVVTVDYSAAADSVAGYVSDVLTTLAAVTGDQ